MLKLGEAKVVLDSFQFNLATIEFNSCLEVYIVPFLQDYKVIEMHSI